MTKPGFSLAKATGLESAYYTARARSDQLAQGYRTMSELADDLQGNPAEQETMETVLEIIDRERNLAARAVWAASDAWTAYRKSFE